MSSQYLDTAGKEEVVEIRSTTCKEDPCRVPIGGHATIEVDFVPSKWRSRNSAPAKDL